MRRETFRFTYDKPLVKRNLFSLKKLFPCLLAKEKEEREGEKRGRKGWKEGRRNILSEIAGRWKGGKQKNGRRKL